VIAIRSGFMWALLRRAVLTFVALSLLAGGVVPPSAHLSFGHDIPAIETSADIAARHDADAAAFPDLHHEHDVVPGPRLLETAIDRISRPHERPVQVVALPLPAGFGLGPDRPPRPRFIA
jgi:hypothetical protein